MRVRFAHQAMLGILLICPSICIGQENLEECTIGVASGKASADGRPLLWKNRDGLGRDYEVVYCKDGRFKHLVMAHRGDSREAGGGVNEVGFCAVYSAAFNLPEYSKKGVSGGSMMKWALEQCVTVDDFENLLKQTNISGRTTACNIGVIDAFGGAAIFETGNYSYTRFDATDPKVAPQGYIIRATYAFTGGSGPNYGRVRYDRANQLWQQVIEKNQLDYRYVLRKACRDLSDAEKVSYTHPEMEATQDNTLQVLNNQNAISRPNTTYAVLFHGVKSDENPSLTTFWVILGGPIFSVAVPSWVIAESTAPELDGEEYSPLCTAANDLYLANYVTDNKRKLLLNPKMLPDIWALTYPAEDRILDRTESVMSQWRQDYPTAQEVASFHRSMASEAMGALEEATEMLMRKGGPTANLRIALHMRSVEKAKAFIEGSININVSDGHGYAPLHYAVQNNQKEIVQLLIWKNADVNLKTRLGQSPLHIALDGSNKDIVELLLIKAADFNSADNEGNTSLHLAAKNGQRDIVKLLIDEGANLNAKNKKGHTPVDIALSEDHSDIVKLLIEKGSGVSSIHLAAYLGDSARVSSFIEGGSDVNAKDQEENTPLHYAAEAASKEVVELLLARGADIKSKGKYGATPLHWCSGMGHKDTAEFLITKGADIDARADKSGETPLHWSANSGRKAVVELLIAKGADINVKDKTGHTPLYWAVDKGHRDVAEVLIAKGADVNAKENKGETALSLAKQKGYTKIVELLRKHGAKE